VTGDRDRGSDIVPVGVHELAARSASLSRRGIILLGELSYSPLAGHRHPSVIGPENAGQITQMAR